MNSPVEPEDVISVLMTSFGYEIHTVANVGVSLVKQRLGKGPSVIVVPVGTDDLNENALKVLLAPGDFTWEQFCAALQTFLEES